MQIVSYHLTNLFFLVYDAVKSYVRKGEHRDDEVLILFLKADGLKDFFWQRRSLLLCVAFNVSFKNRIGITHFYKK